MLLKKHRNALYEAIQNLDLNPGDFRPANVDEGGRTVFQLQLRDTPLKFTLRPAPDSRNAFDCRYTIFAPSFPESSWNPLQSYAEMDHILGVFDRWLIDEVREYLVEEEAPDLWTDLQATQTLRSSERSTNEAFTPDEIARLRQSLHALHADAEASLSTTPEQLKILSGRIEYLIEAAERLGKKDWLSAATGALIGFVVEAALTSVAAREFMQLADSTLRWILDTPLLLP